MMDIIEYNEVCTRVSAKNQNLRLKVHLQVDFNECMFGLFGIFINDMVDCRWREYWIELPILDEGFMEWDGDYIFSALKCFSANRDFNVFYQLSRATIPGIF